MLKLSSCYWQIVLQDGIRTSDPIDVATYHCNVGLRTRKVSTSNSEQVRVFSSRISIIILSALCKCRSNVAVLFFCLSAFIIHNCLYTPLLALRYDSVTWTTGVQNKSKITTAKMTFIFVSIVLKEQATFLKFGS
jgi:hypothetical protein